jgi:hypothetical protein
MSDKGNNKITELRTILQRESPNSFIMVCGGHPGNIPMSSEEDRG